MIRPTRKDIKDLKTFEKFGDTFEQVRSNPETGWYLYDRGNHYEVVRGKRYVNPDGSIVYTYPGSEDWGRYGYTVYKNRFAEKLINFLMGAKTRTAEELFEFKNTL